MRLPLRDVLRRAAQRGYTLDEIRPCLTKDLGGGWWEIDATHPAYPHARDTTPPPGLGDIVAGWLQAFGITEERVSAIVGGDCGCAKRKAALTELGKRIGIG